MIYKCEHCRYTTNRLQNLERHNNRKYPCNRTQKEDTCNIQNPTTDQPNTAVQQLNTVLQQPNTVVQQLNTAVQQPNTLTQQPTECADIRCSKCNKKFTRKDNMRVHEKKCEGLIDPKQCQTCLKVFTTTWGRLKHKRNVKC